VNGFFVSPKLESEGFYVVWKWALTVVVHPDQAQVRHRLSICQPSGRLDEITDVVMVVMHEQSPSVLAYPVEIPAGRTQDGLETVR
jgi:hypothetical protein